VFPGSGSDLEALGYELRPVLSSIEQRQLASAVDLVLTSPDNLYAWAAAGDEPLRVIAGAPDIALGLYAGPQPDGPLAVDVPGSGFAFLARALDGDRRPVVAVGATPARADALREGRAGIALLHPPFLDGLTLVMAREAAFPEYQAAVVATRHARVDDEEALRERLPAVSERGLEVVWELRHRFAPEACPPDWRLAGAGR